MLTIWHFLAGNWPCISTFGLVGYLLGSIVTRKVMAPAFCPRCIRQNDWLDQMKKDKK